MKIITNPVWDIASGVLISGEWSEYEGPVMRCDRSQSKQVAKQGMAQSAENQQQGATAFGGATGAITDYGNQVKAFQAANPYGVGGQFQQDQNRINADSSNAGTNSIGRAMALNAAKTGQNAASYAPSLAEAGRQGSRDEATGEATADQKRIASNAAYNAQGVQMAGLAPDMYARLYGTATGGASGNLNPAASAAKTPGFMDQLTGQLIQGGATVGAAFCPCEGSMIQMSDGSEKPVEELKKGDFVWAVGNFNPPNEILETPFPKQEEGCWEIETDGGLKHSGSSTHTVGLVAGGYGFMPELQGKVVIGKYKAEMVTAARAIGTKTVYPLKVGGTHCYMADGIYILA